MKKLNRSEVRRIWLTDTAVWIELIDGRKAKESFADYRRLAEASDEERRNYNLSRFGIHWPHLDEDLSYEGFFAK